MLVEEKIKLILDTAKVLTQAEFRGNILDEFHPKVHFDIQKKNEYYNTNINLEYSDGKVGEAINWSGMASSLDDALNGNVLCLEHELSEKIEALEKMLLQIKAALPEKYLHI